MNYLTRTQKAIYPVRMGNDELVKAEFANDLEAESDQLAKQCVKFVEEIGTMRAELNTAKRGNDSLRAVIKSWKQDEGADAARLEWLIEHKKGRFSIRIGNDLFKITRDAIDKAMEEHNK